MNIKARLAAGVAGALIAATGMASAEVTLNAVTGLPSPTPVSQVFLEYVERVNAAG